MKLSLKTLESVGIPAEMLSWFASQYGNRDVEYQDALNALARAELPNLANVLMECIGADDSAHLEFDSGYDAQPPINHLFAAGDLTIRGDCHLAGWLRAGSHIRSDGNICAQSGITSGASIQVAQNVRSNGAISSGGRIDVGGNLTADAHIHSGYAITSGGDIQAGAHIEAGQEAQRVLDALAAIYDTDDCQENPITTAFKALLEASSGVSDPFAEIAKGRLFFSVKSGRGINAETDLSCVGAICSGGTIRVGGAIHARGEICSSASIFAGSVLGATSLRSEKRVSIDGNLSVTGNISVHGDLFVGGDVVLADPRLSDIKVGGVLRTDGSISCVGPVTAVAITAGGNVSAGSLRTTGDLVADGEICVRRHIACSLGSVSANGSIFAGGSIQAGSSVRSSGEIFYGAGYGLFAGTSTRSSVATPEHRSSQSAEAKTDTPTEGDVA